MADLKWSEVVEEPRESATQSILKLLDSLGWPATSWQKFSVERLVVEIGGWLWWRHSQLGVFVKKLVISSTSSGEGLTKLSASHFGNTRIAKTRATRYITLTCDAAEGPHSIAVESKIVSDADGHKFRNIEDGTTEYPVTLTSGGSLTLLWRAESGGTEYNLDPDAVDTIVTTMAGVTITDDDPDIVAIDEEEDDRLHERNQLRWPTLSPLELFDDKVRALALDAAPTVTLVGIDATNPRGQFTCDVYLARADATAASGDVDAVQTRLDGLTWGDTSGAANTRPFYVQAAPEQAVDITWTAYFDDSEADETTVSNAVDAALTAFFRKIPIGGFDFSPGPSSIIPVEDIYETIKGAHSAIKHVVLTTPTTDVTVTTWAKVTRGTWTPTYTPLA